MVKVPLNVDVYQLISGRHVVVKTFSSKILPGIPGIGIRVDLHSKLELRVGRGRGLA